MMTRKLTKAQKSKPIAGEAHCLHCSAPVCAACGFCQGCKNYICDKCSDKYKHWFTPDGKNHGGLGVKEKKEAGDEDPPPVTPPRNPNKPRMVA
jgi:hypothetical protein